MSLTIHDCAQGSPEWFAARAGIASASEFSTIMAKGRGGGDSVTRRKYMLTLIGERMTGEVQESYSNAHMERGKVMEAEARDLYQFRTDHEPQLVGFLRDDDKGAGASPDAMIGTDGLLEIKTRLPHLQLEVLASGVLPPENKAQVQGQLWISGRQWVDFVSYWPKLPLFLIRVERDEDYIRNLAEQVAQFNHELAELESKFRAMV